MRAQNRQALDWSGSDEKVRALGFKSFRAWCIHHGFSHKSGYALRKGCITWGIGPKVQAIIDQAVQDGVAVEIDEANDAA